MMMGEKAQGVNEMPDDVMALVRAARHTRRNAVAPLTNITIGAALEDSEGRIWTGCKIESRYAGHGLSAERVALYKALSEGVRSFKRLALVGPSDEPFPAPCGASLQALKEYAPRLRLILFNTDSSRWVQLKLSDLLPDPGIYA